MRELHENLILVGVVVAIFFLWFIFVPYEVAIVGFVITGLIASFGISTVFSILEHRRGRIESNPEQQEENDE